MSKVTSTETKIVTSSATTTTFVERSSDGRVLSERSYTKITENIEIELVNQQDPKHQLRRDLLCTDWITEWDGIAVSGGHVLNALIPDESASLTGDVDVFLVGSRFSVEDIRKIIKRIYKQLKDYYGVSPYVDFQPKPYCDHKNGELYPNGPVKASSVRFKVPNVRKNSSGETKHNLVVQLLIGYQFETVNHLLRSIDLNNCQFAYKNGVVYSTAGAANYLKDKTIYYYNPENNTRRRNRMIKYQERPYNKIVEVFDCPEYQSPADMIDYNNPENDTVELFASYVEALQYIKSN